MHFTIKDIRYVVAISNSPLLIDGRPHEAFLDRRHRRIVISHEVSRHERRMRLFHELSHVFDDVCGVPDATDDEAMVQHKAEFSDWIHEQYNAQGGDVVLEALNPEPDVKANELSVDPFDYRRCGYCQRPVAHGSVHEGDIQTDAEGKSKRELWIECEDDSYLTVWWELCGEDGAPTGIILPYPKPRVLRGRQASDWIKAHAEVCR